MRNYLIIVVIFLTGCGDPPASKARHFTRDLPDTSASWSGKRTGETFLLTRQFERRLKLNSLQDGILGTEFRIWDFRSSVDPQGLTILQSTTNQNWQLRKLTFNYTNPDSLISETNFTFKVTQADTLQLNKFWHIDSQSDLKNGDQYGCLDGNTIFVELANSNQYRLSWYNCPFINRDRDSTFEKVNEIIHFINKFSDRSE